MTPTKPDLLALERLALSGRDFAVAAALGVPVETTVPSNKGAAPPRKRPFRVFKKLAKRGFRAHYGEGEARAPRQVASSRLCYERLPVEGPGIERTLYASLAPLLLRDGKLERFPLDYTPAELRVPQLSKRVLPLRASADSGFERPLPISHDTYVGHYYGAEAAIGVFPRHTILMKLLVYALEGNDAETALDRPFAQLHRSLNIAARYPTSTRTVAAQTSYRPCRLP